MEAEENQPPPPVSSTQSMPPSSLGGNNGGSAAGMDPALVSQRRERRNQRQAAHINQNIGGREREVSATGRIFFCSLTDRPTDQGIYIILDSHWNHLIENQSSILNTS